MPKVKVPRKSVSLDMTARCDVAFLLLTFFILTTRFKPNETAVVDTPTSISATKLPDTDIMVISVTKDGEVFFGIDGQYTRADLLDRIGQVYKIQFSEQDKAKFALMDAFGMPVGALKNWLALDGPELNRVKQTGIPCDSVHNELKDWVINARYANPRFRIAIKGDKGTNYDKIKYIISTLQGQNINKFNLVKGLEAKPQL